VGKATQKGEVKKKHGGVDGGRIGVNK